MKASTSSRSGTDFRGEVELQPIDVPGEGFPKSLRLRSKKDFDRVFAVDRVVMDRTLVIHGAKSDLAWTRLGLSISKRVGNAPLRNRWKRLIREAFRRQRGDLPKGLDIIVRPRKGSRPEYQVIVASMGKLVNQLGNLLLQRAPRELP